MKTWIKTNLSKITLALALTGAVTGVIGLIMGGVLTHENNSIKYFLKSNGERVYGDTIIWVNKNTSSDIFILYFGSNSIHSNDIKWDGKYPSWYFN